MKTKHKLNLPKGYKRIKLPDYKKWITALESGKFRQARSVLTHVQNKHVSYCCLAVLSRIQGRLVKDEHSNKHVDASGASEGLSNSNPCFLQLSESGEFPEEVYISSNKQDAQTISLTGCNDVLELSFKEIAEIIKKIWKA
jgi:hypothetical protein